MSMKFHRTNPHRVLWQTHSRMIERLKGMIWALKQSENVEERGKAAILETMVFEHERQRFLFGNPYLMRL